MNSTILHSITSNNTFTIDSLIPRTPHYPIYYTTSPSLLPSLTDKNFSLIAPTLFYWLYALFFIILDHIPPSFFDLSSYRIETPAHLKELNQASPGRVASFVLIQQALGVVLTIVTVKEDDGKIWPDDHRDGMRIVAPKVVYALEVLLGKKISLQLLKAFGTQIVEFTYWWAIPAVQFVLALAVMETWQYWIHRLSHHRLIYKHTHSWHHEIHAPYSFAALYAHPLEALILNIFGAALGFKIPMLTTRMGIVLFVFSTCKAVDDHSGYKWPRFGPWGVFCLNPFQWVFGESSVFHDFHHARAGQKVNYSQPFTTFWDRVCGTFKDPHDNDEINAINLEKIKLGKSKTE